MDTVSSAEFRKTYAKIAEPTIVTVNGHAIGVWSPTVRPYPGLESPRRTHTGHRDGNPGAASDRFNTQPFRGPIPKKGR